MKKLSAEESYAPSWTEPVLSGKTSPNGGFEDNDALNCQAKWSGSNSTSTVIMVMEEGDFFLQKIRFRISLIRR